MPGRGRTVSEVPSPDQTGQGQLRIVGRPGKIHAFVVRMRSNTKRLPAFRRVQHRVFRTSIHEISEISKSYLDR